MTGVDAGVAEPVGRLRRLARMPLLLLIRFYQRVISPWTPPSCRYYPSCSTYAYQAVSRHGVLRGSWLALRRLARCHPWAAGGVDHVPPARARPAHPHPHAETPTPLPGA